MPIDTIGQMNLQMADISAGGQMREIEDLRRLGSDIGGSINNASRSAEILHKQAIEEQKKKDADALLKSGVEGVSKYANELGLDPKVYTSMASTYKSPEQFKDTYILMQKTAEKQQSERKQQEILSTINVDLKDAMDTSDPAKIAMVGNKINAAKATTTDQNTIKQLESIEKGLNSVREASAKGSGGISGKDKFMVEDRMKSQFDNITKSKRESIEFVEKAINLGEAAIKNPKGKNTASDISLIMSFNKILDPGSVVREGEYDRVEKAQGVFNWLGGLINSMTESGGAKLTDGARKNLIDAMKSMKKLSELSILEQGGDAISTANRRGLDLRAVAGSVVRKNPEESDLMVRAFSSNATEKDKQDWENRRSELLNNAFESASRAAMSQGVDSKYEGENVFEGFSLEGANQPKKTSTRVTPDMSIEDMLNTLPEG